MDFFRNSYHSKKCIYSSTKDLLTVRTEVNKACANDIAIQVGELVPLTVEEEVLLLSHYQKNITDVCRLFRFPPTVALTSHWLLARMMLKKSWMQLDAKHTMLTCILVASKCENIHLTEAEFSSKNIKNVNIKLMLELELEVLRAVDYQLFYFQPTESLAGLLLDYETFNGRKEEELDSEIIKAAFESLEKICSTDATLLFIPSRLSILALLITAPDSERDRLNEYLQTRLGYTKDLNGELLEGAVKVIKDLLNEASLIDRSQIVSIDRKLILLKKARQEAGLQERGGPFPPMQ